MEMNIGQVVASVQAINAVLHDGAAKRERILPFRLKLRLTKIKEDLQKDFDLYEEHRHELVKKYRKAETVNSATGEELIEVDPEQLEAFYKEVEEVLRTPSEHDFGKITMEELAPILDEELDMTELQIKAFFTFVADGDSGGSAS